MARKTTTNSQAEDFRIEIDTIFRDFLDDPDTLEIDFPNDYSTQKRKYVHERCRKLGLKSKSRGKEPNRILTVYKIRSRSNQFTCNFSLSRTAFDLLSNFSRKNPRLTPQLTDIFNSVRCDYAVGRLFFGNPVMVDAVVNGNFIEVKQSLPTYQMKEEILNTIENNKITIVSAETGSGKTTQVPQYILENAHRNRQPCRIICTQPRRISTVAIAERVSAERNEPLGSTVGYQIKLESKLGPKTALIYCTTGVLLRTLMITTSCLDYVTYVIIDEIHERDKFTDFLLIYLKENLARFNNLKIILMSATMDVDLFLDYFNKEPSVLSIPGRNFPITEWFLDDTLALINYKSDAMENVMKGDILSVELENVDANLLKEMDTTLLQCINYGREDDYAQLLQLIITDKVPINYSDVCFGYTALMVAASKGKRDVVETLLNMGADVSIKCKNSYTAAGYALSFGYQDIADLLEWFAAESENQLKHAQLTEIYDRTISDDIIDYDLIIAIIQHIQSKINNEDGILIFLPGYDDIISCCDRVYNSAIDQEKIKICMLHGGMHISAQHEVFTPSPGRQKIILSTNVAETSITIDDVVFVINSGKVKEKSYESIGGTSSLVTKWASMACVKQRAGRAGRTKPGMCFHMLSKKRYEALQIHTIPEILRVPLHELCLQTKLLAPQGTSIDSFLLKAMEQPARTSINTAISGLITLGALDKEENLTRLGTHLLQLSVEPHLAKMLIYSVIFKCVDPVLTIVATLAHKEPFILPTVGLEKGQANAKRKSLSFGSLSDHMSILKAFQMWQKAKQQRKERQFCQEYFISYGAMEIIMVTRNHLLGQLRACGFVPSNGRDSMHELSRYSDHWPLVKAVLTSGLYPNIAFPNADKFHTMTENKVIMHTTSSLRNVVINSELWCIFEEISKLGAICNIKNVTAITPATVVFSCGSALQYSEQNGIITIDDKLQINVSSPMIWKFRTLLDDLIQRKVKNPRLKFTRTDEIILETFDNILSAEDSSKGLFQPPGVGDRPLFIYNKMNDYNPDQNEAAMYSRAHPTAERFLRIGHQRPDENSNNQPRHSKHPYRPVPHSRYNMNGYGHHSSRSDYEQPSSSKGFNVGHRRLNENEAASPILVNAIAPKDIVIPHSARFFVIRPTETRNIIISVSQGTWNFSPQTEKKIFRLFMEGFFIVLLFTARGTNYFQGVARLLDTNRGQPNVPCPIEWLGTNSVNYDQIRHLVHPKVHMVEDGYELQYCAGRDITYMLMYNPDHPDDSSRPILGGTRRVRQY
ncbi:Ankyrin repeat-containing protein [Oryctes borbonicus]|uniref:Ankyrin repeat-containing protein n=1 Tax=Oryctes borbonicus TaxID=1629725 RepID=A0A0T6B0E3_9SCAR|nr:Ankyrin repeat-containing protein [Oryctes borbonicus]